MEPNTDSSSLSNSYFPSWPLIESSSRQDSDAGYNADVSGDSPIHNNEDLPEDRQGATMQQHPYFEQFPRHNAYDESISDSAVSLDTSGTAPPERGKTRRLPRISQAQQVHNVLGGLRDGCLSLLDALLMVINPTSTEFSRHRAKIYEGGGSKLRQVLDTIMSDEEGSGILVDWMRPYAIQQVCDTVKDEMEALGKDFCTSIPEITPTYIKEWTMEKNIGIPANTRAPTLLQVIRSTVETRQSAKNKVKDCEGVSVRRLHPLCVNVEYLGPIYHCSAAGKTAFQSQSRLRKLYEPLLVNQRLFATNYRSTSKMRSLFECQVNI